MAKKLKAKEDENFQAVIKAAARVIGDKSRVVEHITNYMDRHFKGANLRGLPEYKAAVDALEKYSKALVTRMNSAYDEQR
jgi:hypothetical protein